jgi:hypothetical protein
VDGGMNVVGNAYIGNVMLTTTSSLVQQVKISNDGVRKHNWGVGGVWWAGVAGNVNIGGNEYNWKYGYCGNVFLTTAGT